MSIKTVGIFDKIQYVQKFRPDAFRSKRGGKKYIMTAATLFQQIPKEFFEQMPLSTGLTLTFKKPVSFRGAVYKSVRVYELIWSIDNREVLYWDCFNKCFVPTKHAVRFTDCE